ncbi:MAG: Fpg/Nei family DNA glycosylase [Bacteriovoracaceae bacterium]|nr:Fpg/Nei family DNA glycosylase [Bacteriovoracaceae bacterium]
MPELPELETIRRQLSGHLPCLLGEVTFSKHLPSFFKAKVPKACAALSFKQAMKFLAQHPTVLRLERPGKFLRFDFAEGYSLISHLGMSGGWRLSSGPCLAKHCHLSWQSAEGSFWSYVDPRRFGQMALIPTENWSYYPHGVDCLAPDFTPAYLQQVFAAHPRSVLKPFLLGQQEIAGIGNYLACEICAKAKVLPTTLLQDLTPGQIKAIHQATLFCINQAIKRQGTTFGSGYRDALGAKGQGKSVLKVFQQSHCGRCGHTVKKITLQGRGTYYCPQCQH